MNPDDIPRFSDWIIEGSGFNLGGFLLSSVDPADVLASSMILFPEFIEYRGCVFLKFKFDRNAVDRWFGELDGQGRAVEAMVNHVHLWDLFTLSSEADYEVANALAVKMAETWQISARSKIPSREVSVEFSTNSEDSSEYGPTLTLTSV